MVFFFIYDKYSVIPEYMFNKPFSGPIISCSTKCMNGFILYPTSDIEHYQLMKLHEFFLIKWTKESILCYFALLVSRSVYLHFP